MKTHPRSRFFQRPHPYFHHAFPRLAAALALACLTLSPLHAADRFWGNPSGVLDFSDPVNWQGAPWPV